MLHFLLCLTMSSEVEVVAGVLEAVWGVCVRVCVQSVRALVGVRALSILITAAHSSKRNRVL